MATMINMANTMNAGRNFTAIAFGFTWPNFDNIGANFLHSYRFKDRLRPHIDRNRHPML